MKKILIIAFVLVSFSVKAQTDSFFKWNYSDDYTERTLDNNPNFYFPDSHGLDYDGNAPLGSGLLVLTALGAGYAVAKRRHSSRLQN